MAGQGATLRAGASLVLVPTTVRTKKGEPVFTLKAEDFNVTDDGVPQKVRLEEDSGALPLALVVVLEVGGSGIDEARRLLVAGDDGGERSWVGCRGSWRWWSSIAKRRWRRIGRRVRMS